MRYGAVFFYLHFSERSKSDEEPDGGTVGGESIFGRLALIRTKLGLTETELMESSWISINLQMYDFPYWDSKAKKVITSKTEADQILSKYF